MYFSMCAFFISHLFANDIIWLPIDPINNSGYLVNPLLQNSQANQKYYDIQVNGGIDIPLSTFVFDVAENHIEVNDSMRTRSVFHFMKGDYLYRELLLKTQSLSMKSGTITAFAHSRSYSGKFGNISEGPLLQNYLVNYNNSSTNNYISLTMAYHLEDYNLPISNTDSIQKMNESYLSGLTYIRQTKLGHLEYSVNTHISNTNIDNMVAEKWFVTNMFKFISREVIGVNPYFSWRKNVYDENIYRFGFAMESNQLNLKGNLLYRSSPNIEFETNYTFKVISLGLHRQLQDMFVNTNDEIFANGIFMEINNSIIKSRYTYHIIENNNITTDATSLKFTYQSSIIKLNSEFYTVKNENYFLNSYVKNDAYLYFPYFQKYTPFLYADYTYYALNSTADVWDYTLSSINNEAHRFNLQLGIKLETFSITYHFKNLLDDRGKISNNYEDVDSHSYLKIQWQFEN